MGGCAAGELVALGPRCGAPMLSRVISPLHTDFPHVKFSASDGQHWRVHGKGCGAWYFASVESHPGEDSIGRFDLHEPLGTCYVGTHDTAVAMEVLALAGLLPTEARDAVADRQVSAMALDAFYGKPIADFTSPLVERFGAPAHIEQLERADARPWAQAAWDGGFHGIRYPLKKDPEHRSGLALFGPAGPRDKPITQGDPQPFVVGQLHSASELAERPFRGDPLSA